MTRDMLVRIVFGLDSRLLLFRPTKVLNKFSKKYAPFSSSNFHTFINSFHLGRYERAYIAALWQAKFYPCRQAAAAAVGLYCRNLP